MTASFHRFGELPPEIRQEIWHHALLGEGWAVTHFRRGTRRKPGVRISGRLPRAVGQACREAREAMRRTHTLTDRFGWIDFDRHIFYFRDDAHDGRMLAAYAPASGLLHHMRHVIVHPRDYWRLKGSMAVFQGSGCLSLRTVVLCAPWLEPPRAPYDADALDLAPYWDHGRVFRTSPAEMDLAGLIADMEGGGEAEAARTAGYRKRLEAVAEASRDKYGDDDHGPWWYQWHQFAVALESVGLCGNPRLYLRTRKDLCPPELYEADGGLLSEQT